MKTNSLHFLFALLMLGVSAQAQYCMLPGQTPYSSLQPGITNFQLNTINRTSGNSESSSAVVVVTGLSTTVTPGQTYTISITHSEDSQFFPGARNNLRVWVDYNNNFSWTDAGETVLSKDLEAPATTYTATFTVPISLSSGTYALRATAKMSNDAGHTLPTPCNSPADPLGYHGEMEDYSLVVVGSANPGQAPTTSFAVSGNTVCLSGVVTTSNASTGTPTPTYSWSTMPTTGVTFSPSPTATNPTIKFLATGAYTISCSATNSLGTQSSSKTLTVTTCNSVGLPAIEGSQVRLFPNPADQKLTIDNPPCQRCEVLLVDCMGRVLLKEMQESQNGRIEVNLTSIPKGLYYLRLEGEMISPVVVDH